MPQHSTALPIAWVVLRLLILFNWVMGVFIIVMLGLSFSGEDWFFEALKVGPDAQTGEFMAGMRAIMVLGLASIPLFHLVFTRVLRIIETVRIGDPFIRANAVRLRLMAWTLLGLEILHIAVAAIAKAVSTPSTRLDIDWEFSVTALLAILLLFVLAQAFAHGAQMREDLEGTV